MMAKEQDKRLSQSNEAIIQVMIGEEVPQGFSHRWLSVLVLSKQKGGTIFIIDNAQLKALAELCIIDTVSLNPYHPREFFDYVARIWVVQEYRR